MKLLLKFYFFVFFFVILSGLAQEKQDDHLMISESKYGFDSTVLRLESQLRKHDEISIFAKIEHHKNAEKADLKLSEKTVFIFGNSKQGTLLMQKDQLAGLDLPLKMLVYKDGDKTIITYSSTNYLKNRYELKKAKNLTNAERMLKDIASKVSGSKVQKSGKFLLDKHQGIKTEISEFDFETTHKRIISAIEDNPNLNIFSEIDHFKNGREVNISMRPSRLIVFGNPKIGTPIMQESTKIALELPVKILVWRDEAGVVKISYNDPAFLAKRFKLTKNISQLETMKSALENLSQSAAKY